MGIVFWRYYHQVAHQQTVSIPLALEKLAIVLHVVDARENLLEVALAELLFLEVQYYVQVVLCGKVLLSLKQLSHQLAQIGLWW